MATTQPASAGTILEETSPYFGWRSYWVNVLLSEIVLLLLPGGFILGATWPRFSEALPGLVIAALVVLPIALLMAWSQNASLRSKSGWVKYSDGMVSTIADSNIHSAPLARCHWYYGNSTRATTCDFDGHPETGVPAILIKFPHECKTKGWEWRGDRMPGGPVIAAVGFDAEARQAWQELLCDCGTLHDTEREKMPSPLSGSTVLLLAFLLVPLVVIGVARASRLVDGTLTAMGVADHIACGVAGTICMLVILYALAYLCLFFTLHTRRCCVSSEQRAAITESWRHRKVGFLVLIVYFAIPPFFNANVDLVENVIRALVTLLLTGLVALHFHFLLKGPRSQASD
jgi:hypothetical protein